MMEPSLDSNQSIGKGLRFFGGSRTPQGRLAANAKPGDCASPPGSLSTDGGCVGLDVPAQLDRLDFLSTFLNGSSSFGATMFLSEETRTG
jgi:hypothetical protein